MKSKVMENLSARAKKSPSLLVFPEASEPDILAAAGLAAHRGIAHPILIGDSTHIDMLAKEHNISLEGVQVLPLPQAVPASELAASYVAGGGSLPESLVRKRLTLPLYYAAMLLRLGKVDAMVAGLAHSTADVIFAAKAIVGMQEGIVTPSSMFLMEIPGYNGSEEELIVFADCGVCVDPSPSDIADIAIATAHTVRKLLAWDPRVALLSFSTKGSSRHPRADTTREALSIVRQRAPWLSIDGELQLDAAIVPAVASKKLPEKSDVAGRANILIFPDLNAGNITYKAVQRFANAHAYGPFLQGFTRVVSDLSRGSSV
ncbi:MAG: phosphate acetyltransferase, partial [Coriobacteriales bacterium]|nr:phosphate acetyltransferase [Coriobacteriales bacterium]